MPISEFLRAERLTRFFDARSLAFSIPGAGDERSPMQRVGRALGKASVFAVVVGGAAAYGAVEHRMSDRFQQVGVDEAILEVASATGFGDLARKADEELSRRGISEPPGATAPAAEAGETQDLRLTLSEMAVSWFEENGVQSPAVREALSRWGIHAHGDHYHIEGFPEPGDEMLPSPWALRTLISEASLQAGVEPAGLAAQIDTELRVFMISSDLCTAGHVEECLATIASAEGDDVMIEMNARSGALSVRPYVVASAETPSGPGL
ncbi:hypothetical protein [Roseivivax sp. CAU 1761]